MKDIKSFEGKYAVTSCGKVWSYRSKKFLKPEKMKNGYLRVDLCGKHYFIHRLVAETYLSNPDNLPEVHHIDANKEHNYINNLQWMSKRDNLIEMHID